MQNDDRQYLKDRGSHWDIWSFGFSIMATKTFNPSVSRLFQQTSFKCIQRLYVCTQTQILEGC